MKRIKCNLLSIFALLPTVAFCALNVNPNSTSVTPGVWCGNFAAAKSYAEENAMPLVLFWGNEGCTHCAALNASLSTSAALSWVASQRAVFCFVEGKSHYDVAPNYGAKEFAQNAGGMSPASPTAYPYICYYMVGDRAMTYGGIEQFSVFKSNYEQFLSTLRKTGAYFPFGDTVNDRLEAILGETAWVDVPVVRSGDLSAATTELEFKCGSATWKTSFAWASGDTEKTIRYTLPTEFQTVKSASVRLLAPDSSVLDERTITGVSEVENSTKNPKWLGEPIDYGEWTMDLDAVTNLVKTSGGYAMVLFAGGCWCPDCAMTDARLFDREEFKEWAKVNRVALGIIDIPNNPSAVTNYPSLLTYTSYRTSDNYITLRGSAPADETMRYQSGAGFLSRHSVSREAALAVIERNLALAGNTVLKGGWNSADGDGKARPGVPSLVALRPDGSICGRWTPFNDVGPSEYSEGFLRRFEEMFDQANEAAEESNDHWTTTTQKISANGSVSATVSAADSKDVYLIEAEPDTMMTFDLESTVATPFTLTVTDYSGDVPKTLVKNTGADDGRVSVTARVESAACYVEVSFPATKGRANHPALAITNLSSTVAGYTLSTSGVMSGGDICFKETSMVVTEGNVAHQVMIQVERRHGRKGAVSVKVARTDSAIDPRIIWNDTTLTWSGVDGESSVKEVPLTIVGDASAMYDLSLRFALELVSADAADTAVPNETSRMTLLVREDDVSGIIAYRNVECLESYELSGWKKGDTVQVRKTFGSLAPGLSLAVIDGVLNVSGSPSALGSSSATYVVTVKRGGVEVSSEAIDFSYTVRAIDFSGAIPSPLTAKNYRNIPVFKDGRMAATLTLSVPATGRLSAKLREADGTTTRYAAKSWSAFNEAESRLSASLASLDADGGTIDVEFASGEVSLAIFGADGKLLAEVEPFSTEPWSATNPADAWEGQYNVQLPQTNFVDGAAFAGRLSGAAYMALRLNGESAKKSGTMLYAGVLPNGRAVSGYATLWSNVTNALMAFSSSDVDMASPYAFSGAFTITPRALSTSRWLVKSAATTEWSVPDAYGHVGAFMAYGGYYDADEIAAAFAEDFENDADRFAFVADTAAVFSGRYGEALGMEPVAAVMLEDGSPALAPGAQNPQAVSLVFSRETGVVYGTLRLPFADESLAVVYRGISLPGWQSCEECLDLPERPWALGACSFADRDDSGFFRNGCAVGLGRYKEQ